MVYCGKPSRGCQMCRTRRIKCDETKPTCNQCAKSRRVCPGYKDEFDLVFRNETKAVERRAQKANKKAMAVAQRQGKYASLVAASVKDMPTSARGASPQYQQQYDPNNPDDQLLQPLSGSEVILPSLNVPPDQLASCHFFANFVLIPRDVNGHGRGFWEHLIPLLSAAESSGRPNSTLSRAFNAAALAAVGNRVSSTKTNFGEQALSNYTKALASLNVDLRDPEVSTSDATLASVLLLGIFENITAKQLGQFNWGSHVEGAIQLVKSRGRKQLRTKIGLHLFVAVRLQMIIHTFTTGKAPIMGVDWWINDTVHDEFAALCHRACIKTGELRAEVARLMNCLPRCPENVELILDLIRRLQTVDQECVHWLENVPEHWQFKTVAWEDNVPGGDYSRAEVFPGRVDVYPDLWVAGLWNLVRTSRLLLASMIVRCAAWVCSPVDYRTTPEYATAARTCSSLITDVAASIPYHFSWHLTRKDILTKHNMSGFVCGEDDSMKGLAGYFVTWPLATINTQDYTTDAQRAWAVGRLKFVSNSLGIRYGEMAANLQVRVPSMLIRRDTLMSTPANILDGHLNKDPTAPSSIPSPPQGYSPPPQSESGRGEYVARRKAELLAKASGDGGGGVTENIAKRLLRI